MLVTDIHKWDLFLEQLPQNQHDIYYSSQYYSVFGKYGDGEPGCFVFEKDGEMAMYPFLMNSVNELGYNIDGEYFDIQGVYGYNGIVSSSYEKKFVDDFFYDFNAFCANSNIIAEFTRFNPLLNNHVFSENNMTIIHDRQTVSLDITRSIDDIWADSYSSKNRNMIRKAEKNGLEIIETDKEDDYRKFYQIYQETMNNVGSSDYLYFNMPFFLNFRQQLKDNHLLLLAKLGEEYIGGIILMIYGKYAHYHLSARKSEYGKYALNNILLHYAIKLAKNKGCELFHFGGGRSAAQDDSLLKFKSSFSKDKRDFYIGKKVHNPEIYNEVVKQWREKYPSSYDKNKNLLLGYRDV